MDMIRHDSKIMNNNMILCCCLTNGSSNKIFILQLTHHLIPILRTPLKMPKVSAFFMAVMMYYYFHTLRPPQDESSRYFSEEKYVRSFARRTNLRRSRTKTFP